MELTLDQALQKGIEAHKAGKVQEADRYYTAILKADPKHPDANHNMGVLAVGVGKVEVALPFFKTALESNPKIDQFWLSYIDSLIELNRLDEASKVLDQAKSTGAKGGGFDKLELRLKTSSDEVQDETQKDLSTPPNILDELKLDKALKLAKTKTQEGSVDDAKRIYQDILEKFPRNKKANEAIRQLEGKVSSNLKKRGNPPYEQLQKLINLYNAGELSKALERSNELSQQYPSSVNLLNIQGAILKSLGQLDSSIKVYKTALSIKPDYADAYNNMGLVLQDQGRPEEALGAYKKALSLKPDYAEAYNNLGVVLNRRGEPEEAIDAYKKALSLKPDYAEAHYNIGIVLQDQGKPEEAIGAYKKALLLKPDYAEAHSNLGISLRDLGKLEEALKSYAEALSLKPDYAEAHSNLGNVFKELERLDEANVAYKKALSLKPDYAEAYNNMGVVLKDQDKPDEAIEAYTKALNIKPNYAEAYSNMGNALQDLGKLEEALEAYTKALAVKPNYAEAYNNMGNALHDQGKNEEAIEAFYKALAIKPDDAGARLNSSFALLNSGRVKEGLDAYEWRWKATQYKSSQRHFLQPLWDGKTSLQDKRILVWCEQGIGDTIIWSSRLSLLASQAGHCIFECQEKLVPLLSRSFPNVEVKPMDVSRDTEREDFDFHLPMASLHRHFIPEITQSPKSDAYLIPDPVRVKFWKDRLSSLGGGPYVGISWKSSNMIGSRSRAFSSLSDWSSLLKLPNINFINLQYTDAADGILQIQNEFGVKVHDFDDLDQYNNLDDVAALSAALDCVVSFATSVPMLTAGVGTLTKCLFLANAKYKNILGGPVGPLVDIFEKNTWEPWSNVLGLIADDIAKL